MLRFLVLVTGATLLIAAGSASAQTGAGGSGEACIDDSNALTGPTRVADGRNVALSLLDDQDGAAAVAAAASPDARWTGLASPTPASKAGTWTLRVTSGAVRVTVSYLDFRGCQQHRALTVTAVPATTPVPFTDVNHPDEYTDATVEIGVISGDNATECAVATADPITVTVRSGTVRERATIGGGCEPWTTTRMRRKHGRFVVSYENGNALQASLVRLALRGSTNGRRVHFTFTIAWHGRTLRKGTITGATRSQPGHSVREGTDAFINYCINENKGIYSEHGTLYCWYPGFLHRSWTITKHDG